MSGLSDLDLVAQAMAPTNTARTSQPAAPVQQPSAQPSTTAPVTAATMTTNGLPPDLADIDLSKLSLAELELLRPLINALQVSDSAGGEGDEDLRIADILGQMDAAGDVADELEGKLDKLLADLGNAEKEIEAGQGAKSGAGAPGNGNLGGGEKGAKLP